MKSLEHTLQRLLKTAARAPQATAGQPSFALETRVLARWRSGPVEDDLALLAVLFQRALICAGAVMFLSAGWTWFENHQEAGGAMALANYTVTIQLKP